jgi:CO/xanthine dehydrogenase Mo-binding subunit
MPEGGGDRNGVPLYQVPSGRVTSHFIATSPVRVSALQSLGGYFNVFSIECLMDELARAGGADPVAFRLAHLADRRAVDVVNLCAQKFGWAARPRGDGRRGCGFAFARYKTSSTDPGSRSWGRARRGRARGARRWPKRSPTPWVCVCATCRSAPTG